MVLRSKMYSNGQPVASAKHNYYNYLLNAATMQRNRNAIELKPPIAFLFIFKHLIKCRQAMPLGAKPFKAPARRYAKDGLDMTLKA